MADVSSRSLRVALVVCLGVLLACAGSAAAIDAQSGGNPPTPDDMVVDVRVVGNQAVSLHKIIAFVRTRPGRNFDPEQIEKDVRELNRSRLFVSVNTSYLRSAEGVIVLFQVVERPTLAYVKYVGTTLMRGQLEKQTGLKVGDAVDPYVVEDGRRKLEEYYHEKGFSKARVSISEGNKPGDRGAVYLIHEGPKQRIHKVEFEGNTIANDDRLKTQISSKPPIMYFFRGELDEEKIDEDLLKLTAYYRGLGFFNAKIGREIELGEDGKWATLRFVINEGPRYKVNEVSIMGTSKFPREELEASLQLKGGKYFDQESMQRDITALQDRYGSKGYVYCVINPEQRLSETPGEMDLVYQIEEGAKYHINRIEVRINGETPHTRVNTVLNRVDMRPLDIADIRKMRDSERRLKASGLFVSNPQQGNVPSITWEAEEEDPVAVAQRSGNYRGQSPDDYVPAYDGLMNFEAPTPHGEWEFVPTLPQNYAEQASYEPQQTEHRLTIQPDVQTAYFQAAEPPVGRFMTAVGVYSNPGVVGPVVLDEPPYAPQPVDQTGNPFRSRRLPSAQPIVAAEPEMQVRFQSPAGSPSYGQVPLYQTAPGVNTAPAGTYGPSTVVPAQYTAPAPLTPVAPAPNVATPTAPTPVPSYPGISPYGSSAPAYQPPQFGQAAPSPYMGNAPGVGAPPLGYDNSGDIFGRTLPPAYPGEEPSRPLNTIINVEEAQTGRFMLGVGVNSNAGVVGSIILDEQNADIFRLPGSWRDFVEGRAFRGAGQQLRIEAVPGTQVSRYSFIFRQPYLFDTRVQFGLSGYYFQRYYNDWLEERLGGRISLGYQFPYVPDLSVNAALRMEDVGISQPTQPTPQQLTRVLGHSGLYVGEFALVHDTRDNTFLATQGHRIMLGFDQAFGEYDFSRATVEGRQHFLLYERPDRSGRHVLSMVSQLGFTGSATPIYENYFAGGFSSLRGFNFRGVGPYSGNVNIGGQFQWLNTVEYMFPLAADDMIRGVVFCDFGTVEEKIEMHGNNFRVAPGFGLRLTVPAMGPAPIALDFAVPIARAPGDDIQNFAFYVGFGR